jgi:hypothetical protein
MNEAAEQCYAAARLLNEAAESLLELADKLLIEGQRMKNQPPPLPEVEAEFTEVRP